MSVALYLPVETASGALAFAAGIETGRIPCLREYLDEHLARENFAKYPGGVSKLLGIFRVENGVATRVAEGAPRFLTGPQTGVRSLDCEALSLGSTLAGDAGQSGAVALVTPSVPMTGRRDGACISGRNIGGAA